MKAAPLGLALVLAGCGGTPSRPSNVLLIVVDTLRKDHLSCYGYEKETSPHVDQLAAQGWKFENALSQAPWTTPSIGALLSSRYPSMLGIEDLDSGLPEGVALLPEVLREHGWATGAAVSHAFCSAEWGFDRGFDRFDQTGVAGHFGISSPAVTDWALGFLEEHRDRPFFLWLHYFDPHNQYLPHPGYAGAPAPGYSGRVSPRTTFRKLSELAGDLAPEELAEVVRYYDSEIAFTDHHVGRVLDRLERLELLDRTLVVFTADHGEELLDHGRFGHAHSLYQELVGVPLILRIPGEAPRVASEPAALVDLFPTILDHLGLEAPEGLVGHSLLARPSDRTLFAETSRKAELRAAARGRWKLVLDVESGETRLYDLRADPLERSPLPAEGPEAVALRSELEAWMGRLAQPGPVRRVELTPGRVEALGDLGYAED